MYAVCARAMFAPHTRQDGSERISSARIRVDFPHCTSVRSGFDEKDDEYETENDKKNIKSQQQQNIWQRMEKRSHRAQWPKLKRKSSTQ